MKDYNPYNPAGSNGEMRFHQAVWRKTHGPASKTNNSSTAKVNSGVRGESFRAARQTPGGSKLLLYKITTLSQADYFGATKWNPTVDNGNGTFGATAGSEVTVAKCLSGRRPPSEYLDGATVTYAYTSDNVRTATPGGVQNLSPIYSKDDLNVSTGILVPPGLVLVSRVANGTGVFDADDNEIKLIEVQPCRIWGSQSAASTGRFVLTGVAGDYLTATSAGGGSVNIAKNPKLRTSITSQVIDGVTWNYTYTSSVQRSASNGTRTYYQRVSERYIIGDIIYADQPAGGTGVTISGIPLVWLDTNRDGRAWTQRQDQSAP